MQWFACDQCSSKFETNRALLRHISDDHAVKKFSCNYCEKTFTTKDRVQQHEMCIHHSQGTITCKVCGKGFGHKAKLKAHDEQVHKKIVNSSSREISLKKGKGQTHRQKQIR